MTAISSTLPTVRVETLDDVADEAFLDDGGTGQLADGLEVPLEIAVALVHRILDEQCSRALDEPAPMLGGLTPRAAAASEANRVRVADWLQHLENQPGRSRDPADPMASYDLSWMWTELGIDNLRRRSCQTRVGSRPTRLAGLRDGERQLV